MKWKRQTRYIDIQFNGNERESILWMRGRRFNAVEYKTNDKNRTGNYHSRGTQVLPLNEKKRIIDGSNELIADPK